jgi:hypothetical protein
VKSASLKNMRHFKRSRTKATDLAEQKMLDKLQPTASLTYGEDPLPPNQGKGILKFGLIKSRIHRRRNLHLEAWRGLPFPSQEYQLPGIR